jgi:hypothetical protein
MSMRNRANRLEEMFVTLLEDASDECAGAVHRLS